MGTEHTEKALADALEAHRESLGGDIAVDLVDPTFTAGFRAGCREGANEAVRTMANTPINVEGATPDFKWLKAISHSLHERFFK